MNYGRAFSFASEDPDWIKKLIIAALVILIPVVGPFAVSGWALEINRRVIAGESELLPEWSNFGALIISGLKQWVVVLVYQLPAILISVCGFGLYAGLLAASGGSSSDDGGGALTGVAVGAMLCTYCFLFLFLIVGSLMIAPATSVLAETGEIGAALRFGHVFGLLRAAVGPYILSVLILAVLGSVGSSIGSIACGVGTLVAAAYTVIVAGHLHAQAYKIAKSTVSG